MNKIILIVFASIPFNNSCYDYFSTACDKIIALCEKTVDAAKAIHDNGKDLGRLDAITKGLQSAPNAGNCIQEASSIISSNSDQIASSIETGAKNIGGSIEKAGSHVGDSLKFLGYVGGTITILKATYDFGCWSKSTFNPSEEEKALKEKVSLELKKFRAERDLNECLVNNTNRFKNRDGLPVDCAATAQFFTQVAGIKAYNEMKEEYRKYINGK